jgi:hypothetical protein
MAWRGRSHVLGPAPAKRQLAKKTPMWRGVAGNRTAMLAVGHTRRTALGRGGKPHERADGRTKRSRRCARRSARL